MLKQIFNKSLENLKKNWLMSIMLCLMTIISCALFFSLMFVPYVGEFITIFLIVPLVLVPIIFSMQMMHFALRENYQPNGKAFFTYFKAYFRPGVLGVYRIINTILFAMLAELAVSGIVGVILGAVATTNPAFSSILTELQNAIADNNSVAIQNLLNTSEIRLLTYCSVVPGFGVAAMVAFLSSSFNSLSIYFKVKNPSINPGLSQRMYIFARNTIRGKLIKEYWGLNWPIYVLFILGFTGGVAIAYYHPDMSYTFGMFLGLAIGLGASMLYAPIFVSNLEQIYLENHLHFASSPNEFAKKMQESLNAQMDAMQQQMQDLARQQEQMRHNESNDDTQSNDANTSDVRDDNSDVINSDDSHNHIETADNNNVVDAEVKDDESQNK